MCLLVWILTTFCIVCVDVQSICFCECYFVLHVSDKQICSLVGVVSVVVRMWVCQVVCNVCWLFRLLVLVVWCRWCIRMFLSDLIVLMLVWRVCERVNCVFAVYTLNTNFAGIAHTSDGTGFDTSTVVPSSSCARHFVWKYDWQITIQRSSGWSFITEAGFLDSICNFYIVCVRNQVFCIFLKKNRYVLTLFLEWNYLLYIM